MKLKNAQWGSKDERKRSSSLESSYALTHVARKYNILGNKRQLLSKTANQKHEKHQNCKSCKYHSKLAKLTILKSFHRHNTPHFIILQTLCYTLPQTTFTNCFQNKLFCIVQNVFETSFYQIVSSVFLSQHISQSKTEMLQ